MNPEVTIGQKPASILIVDDVAANLQVLPTMLVRLLISSYVRRHRMESRRGVSPRNLTFLNGESNAARRRVYLDCTKNMSSYYI
jgi:hypothetical protein